ncbi:hypothetical protein V2J09_013329 [Rumex salicifolius]
MPSTSEVPTLIVGDFGHSDTTSGILIERKSGSLQWISLKYTLQEQHRKMTNQERKCHYARVLFLSYPIEVDRVDYPGIEDQRLTWIRYHQDELRADVYINIVDAVNNGDTDAKSIGKRIVLPATYTRSPRYLMQNYQDAMALCRTFGNPCLFITFTANPKWSDVTEMLSYIPSQTSHDRPDIMTRVFKLKLKQLSKDLKKHMIFGKTQAWLPHAQILLWLQQTSRTHSAAEIGFPLYRRKNNAVTVTKARTELDNRYVVPYNMYMPMKYRADINVEWCNHSRAIKYLFKYIGKASDKATAMVVHNNAYEHNTGGATCFTIDEIKIHLDCRYPSSCEAVWRIYGFDIHNCVPPVIKHPLHSPEINTVMVRDSQNLASVLKREGVNESMFTAWFALNEVDPRARGSMYAEIPQDFVWNPSTKAWQWRKIKRGIGHIVYYHPTAGTREGLTTSKLSMPSFMTLLKRRARLLVCSRMIKNGKTHFKKPKDGQQCWNYTVP